MDTGPIPLYNMLEPTPDTMYRTPSDAVDTPVADTRSGWHYDRIVACRWRTASDMEARELPGGRHMTIKFDHTIVVSNDRSISATFFRSLFDLPEAPSWGPFTNVQLSDGTLIQFAEPPVENIQPQHYAFHVTDNLFDAVVKRLSDGAVRYWADPHLTEESRINHHHNGRGVYFKDPAGHLMEVLTQSYLQ